MKILLAVAFLFLKTGERFATQETAGPTVTEFAAGLAKQLDGVSFEPRVLNDPAKAVEYVTAKKPPLGIVTPGFYLAYAKALNMEPLLEVKRQNVAEERYVVVSRGETDLAGKVLATTLAGEERFVTGVLLQDKWNEVRLKAVTDVELAALDVAEKGKNAPDAVLMEESTWLVLAKDEELGPKLKAIHRTEPLPGALVVSFPAPAGSFEPAKAATVLKQMAETEAGKALLGSIRVEKFVDVDRERLKKAEARFHGKQ
jgi:hypothetical protein